MILKICITLYIGADIAHFTPNIKHIVYIFLTAFIVSGKRRISRETFLINCANDNKCIDLTATDVSVCKIKHARTLFWGLGCCHHVLDSSLVSDPKLLSLMLHLPL